MFPKSPLSSVVFPGGSSTTATPGIETAEIQWRDGTPCSTRFGDIYFSRCGGLEEARHVFIGHNRLVARFSGVDAGGAFTIAEAGFGCGLNFLAAWQAWEASGPADGACLHFISAERYPLTPDDLASTLSLWPELSRHADTLLQHYPPAVPGVHRLVLDGGRVRLTLFFGDVGDAWRELEFRADAWFLDGFSPSRNPGMWDSNALGLLHDHSRPGTTLSTYTVSGEVYRLLTDSGFVVKKVPGYGRKREMLTATFAGTEPPQQRKPAAGAIAIVGAGIAGSLLARNLADRGHEVTLIDGAADPGTAASGNRQGALYVKLGVEFNDQTRLALNSLLFSQRFYALSGGTCWHPTGLLQLACSEAEQDRQARFIARNQYPGTIFQPVDAAEASRLAGIPVQYGGLWFPRSGWLEPDRLCRSLADHPRIRRCFDFPVRRLVAGNAGWRIEGTTDKAVTAEQIVICAGHLSPGLIPLDSEFRFRTIRGQVSHLPEAALRAPRVVICGPGYINPVHQGVALAGATFDLHEFTPVVTAKSHRENLAMLGNMIPSALAGDLDDTAVIGLAGKVGFRCTTHDYQPVAGQMTEADGRPLAGLYLFTGLGSKGLSYAPLLAEYLADQLTGQPRCLPVSLARRVATPRCHKPDGLQ